MRHLVIQLIILLATINLSAQTVYITKSGTKYHKSDCRYLSQSKIAVDLEEAVDRGFLPCSVCGPLAKSKANNGGNKVGAYQTKDAPFEKTSIKQNANSTQTVYITKSGTKYHQSGCGYLKSSSIPVGLQDAINRGYGPCSVCKTPK